MLCITLVGGLLSYADILIPDENNFIFAGATAGSAIIPKDGTYLIEVSGGPGNVDKYVKKLSSGANSGSVMADSKGGRLSCYMTLKRGDVITSSIIAGGAGTYGAGSGGSAVAISVNGVRIIGAGGGGGYGGYSRNDGGWDYGPGSSVTGINNASFGSGGSGSGSSSTTGSYNGNAGSGGAAGGSGNRGGSAGFNFLDTTKATLVAQQNDSRYFMYRVVAYPEKEIYIEEFSYPSLDRLTIIGNTVSTSNKSAEFKAELPLAIYTVELRGGRNGGYVTGEIMLKQGDILRTSQTDPIAISQGGNIPGGNGIRMDLVDAFTGAELTIAGAGGGTYNGESGGQSTLYYDNGIYGEKTGTVNYEGISTGGSSKHSGTGAKGTDLLIGIYGVGADPNQASANYVDRSAWTSYTSTANSGTGIVSANVKITLKSIATKDQITVVELQRDIAALKASMAAIKVPGQAPVITVAENSQFNVRINQYDDMESIAQDGISIINDIKGDGFIGISGKLTGKGYTDMMIGGKKFTFNVIEEPSSANVKVTFD